MPRSRGQRAPGGALTVAALALLAAGAAPVRALPRPELAVMLGQNFAVSAPPDAGGFSASGALLWPVDWRLGDRLAFGLGLSADDMGSEVGQVYDPHTGQALGATELRQRSVYTAAWRMDLRLGRHLGAEPYASGTWGVSRVTDARLGNQLSTVGSTGFGLAGGLRWPIGPAGSLGLGLRYNRLFNDVVARYMSAGLDWGWRASR